MSDDDDYRKPTKYDGIAARVEPQNYVNRSPSRVSFLKYVVPSVSLFCGIFMGIYYSSFEISDLRNRFSASIAEGEGVSLDLNTQIEALQSEITELSALLEQTETQLKDASSQTALMAEQNTVYEEQLATMQDQMAATLGALEDAQSRISRLSDENASLLTDNESNLEQLRSELANTLIQVESIQLERDQLASKIISLEAELASAQPAIDFLEQFPPFVSGRGFVFFGFLHQDSSNLSETGVIAPSFEFSRDTLPRGREITSDVLVMTVFRELPIDPNEDSPTVLREQGIPIFEFPSLVPRDSTWKRNPENILGFSQERETLSILSINLILDELPNEEQLWQVWLEVCAGPASGCQ